jgi:hypothetical protein
VLAAGIARQPHFRLVRIGILGKQIAAVECGSSDADSVDHEGMRRRSPIACRAGERHPDCASRWRYQQQERARSQK